MRALAIAVLLLAGCDDTRGESDAGPGFDASAPAFDAGGAAADAGTPPPGTDAGPSPGADGGPPPGIDAGAPPPSVAFCTLGCAVEADCTTPSPAYDEDNYVCEGTVCRYTGCVSDGECQSTFSSADYVCRDAGGGLPVCQESCAVDADCGSGTPAFDGDNYTCDGGVCRYLGCNDDAECGSTFGAAYACVDADPPPTPLPIPTARRNCVRRCTTAADCATDSGAFGADNYTCEGGACRYRGCNDDAECRTSLASSAYVCR